MKNVAWLIVGIAAGFAIAHQVNRTREGQRFFANLDAKAREFGEAVSEGYRRREAELRDAIGDAAVAVSRAAD